MSKEQENQERGDQHPPKTYKITVDKKPFEWPSQFITGTEIKRLAKVDASFGVWLKVRGPGEDRQIGDSEKVDLAQEGVEHFFTGETHTTQGGYVLPA